jgi:uncharacterized protein (TIGR02270 family)
MATAATERPIGFRPWEISAMVNREVVEQHAEDAAFLWFSRDRAVRAPHYYLKDLMRLDQRVEANVDGLRVAGPAGWELAVEAMKQEAPGELFAAAVLGFESRNPQRIDSILNLSSKAAPLSRAAISALGWMRFDDAKPILDPLLRSDRAELRRIAIAGYAVHRVDSGEALRQALSDGDLPVQNQAFEAAAQLGRTDLVHSIVRIISSKDETSRFYSAWSAAKLGLRDRDVTDALRMVAEAGHAHAEPAFHMALRCLRLNESHPWLSAMLKDPGRQRFGVIGMGVVGDPAWVSELIGYMQTEPVSRVAGEAFSMITGADLRYLDLDRPKPDTFEASANDDPNDTDVGMDPDEDLPWPAPERVRQWWEQHEHEFQPGARYLRGKLIEPVGLIDALKNGYQRQRAAAALELGLLRPSDPLFEVRAPGRRQMEALAQWSS